MNHIEQHFQQAEKIHLLSQCKSALIPCYFVRYEEDDKAVVTMDAGTFVVYESDLRKIGEA